MKTKHLTIIAGLFVIITVSFLGFGTDFEPEIQEQTFTSNVVETVVTPTTFQAEAVSYPLDVRTTSSEPTVIEDHSTTLDVGNFILPLLQPSHAVTTGQLSVTIDRWAIPGLTSTNKSPTNVKYGEVTVDDLVYTQLLSPTNLYQLDPASDQITTWDVPDPGVVGGDNLDNIRLWDLAVNKTGNKQVWMSPDMNLRHALVKLDPTNDEFTWYLVDKSDAGARIISVAIGTTNTDLVYSMDTTDFSFAQLDLDTNMMTYWVRPGTDDHNGLVVDSSGIVFSCSVQNSSIYRLDPDTGIITIWKIPTGDGNGDNCSTLVIAPNNDIYFAGETFLGHNIVGRLVPGTNTITEWTVGCLSNGVVVNSANDQVYFGCMSNEFGRILPDTGVITLWNGPLSTGDMIPLGFDSSGDVYYTHRGPGQFMRIS